MTALAARGLRKRLGGTLVLAEVDLACEPGSITLISGPNGAGKSTLLRVLAGVLEPEAGVIEVDGRSLTRRRAWARARIGYVPEAADPPGHLTVDELLGLVAGLKRAPRPTAELRAELGIDELLPKQIDQLSLGERRRSCLAAALIGDPALLILDEPTNGLDAGGVDVLAALLTARAAGGCAVLLASHDHSFAERVGARRFEMRNGRLQK